MSKPQNKKNSPKSASKSSGQSGGTKSIGSAFAAQEAAALISRKTGATGGVHKESSLFKQMKEGLSESHMDGLGKMLDQTSTATGKKSAQPFNHNRGQTGHNQTYGADVNRTGVPRRTAG